MILTASVLAFFGKAIVYGGAFGAAYTIGRIHGREQCNT